MESQSRFGLTIVKGLDRSMSHPARVRRGVYPKVTANKRNK